MVLVLNPVMSPGEIAGKILVTYYGQADNLFEKKWLLDAKLKLTASGEISTFDLIVSKQSQQVMHLDFKGPGSIDGAFTEMEIVNVSTSATDLVLSGRFFMQYYNQEPYIQGDQFNFDFIAVDQHIHKIQKFVNGFNNWKKDLPLFRYVDFNNLSEDILQD